MSNRTIRLQIALGISRITLGLLAAMLTLLCLAPGRSSADVEGNKRVLPWNVVTAGAQCYYKVYGHFPARWADVVAAGIVQVELTVPGEGVVDPDDSGLDFAGDVRYLPPTAGDSTARIVRQSTSAPGTTIDAISVPRTYAQLFAEMESVSGVPGTWSQYLENEQYMRLFAIAGVANRLCFAFNMSNDHQAPSSAEQLIQAGFFPIDAGSINPVTGAAFDLSGGPGEIRVRIPDSSKVEDGHAVKASVVVYDLSGQDLGLGWY